MRSARLSNRWLELLRSTGGGVWNCGHEKTRENTIIKAGSRQCLRCHRQRQHDWHERQRYAREEAHGGH